MPEPMKTLDEALDFLLNNLTTPKMGQPAESTR